MARRTKQPTTMKSTAPTEDRSSVADAPAGERHWQRRLRELKAGDANAILPNFTGRITKLTPEFIAQAVRLVEQGPYASEACTALGVCKGTYFEWRARGRAEKAAGLATIYSEFHEALQYAEERCLATNALKFQAAINKQVAKGETKGVESFLSRKSKRWGKKDRVHVEGKIEQVSNEKAADNLRFALGALRDMFATRGEELRVLASGKSGDEYGKALYAAALDAMANAPAPTQVNGTNGALHVDDEDDA